MPAVIEPSDHRGFWTDAAGETHPIERSQAGEAWAMMVFDVWFQEAVDAYGFTPRIYDSADGRERVVELLGPDSPGEYVRAFPKEFLGDRHLQKTALAMILWTDAMGQQYTGSYAPGVVPDRHRKD